MGPTNELPGPLESRADKLAEIIDSYDDAQKQVLIDHFMTIFICEDLKQMGIVDGESETDLDFAKMGYGYLLALGFRPNINEHNAAEHMEAVARRSNA